MEKVCIRQGKPFVRQSRAPVVEKVAKERYDAVNLALKDTKEQLKALTAEAETLGKRVGELEVLLLESKVETALAQANARNLAAAKALIDVSALELQADGVIGLLEQIDKLKIEQSFLFEQSEIVNYVLVPVKAGDAINKSITDYVSRRRKTKRAKLVKSIK